MRKLSPYTTCGTWMRVSYLGFLVWALHCLSLCCSLHICRFRNGTCNNSLALYYTKHKHLLKVTPHEAAFHIHHLNFRKYETIFESTRPCTVHITVSWFMRSLKISTDFQKTEGSQFGSFLLCDGNEFVLLVCRIKDVFELCREWQLLYF